MPIFTGVKKQTTVNMGDTSLIKSGEISFQMKSLLKTSWVKKFCVLYRQTEDYHAYMELFDDKQTFTDYKQKQKKCDVKKVELQHLKSLKTWHEKRKDGIEYTLELKIGKKCHFLQFTKESDFNDWFSKLDSVYTGGSGESRENSVSYGDDDDDSCGENDEVITVNQMYAQTDPVERFTVTVEESTLAKLCDITGQMTMLVGKSEIAFENPKTRTLKYTFQLGWMRRFGKVGNSKFSFECGRKCPNGEGEVSCDTHSANQIHKILSQKSKSNSSVVIPHSPVRKVPDKIILPLNSDNVRNEPPLPKKPDDLGICSGPVAINVGTRHPGVGKKLPTLNPIVRQPSVDEDHQPKKSKSIHSSNDSEKHSIKDNGHVRPASYRSAITAPLVTKELERKFHNNEEQSHEATHEPAKKDSVKTKEDKKKEKEERKERERREKEEKKEEEKRLKEQERERKQKEKVAKKSGKKDKHKDSDKPETSSKKGSFILGGSGQYEETDLIVPASPGVVDDPCCIYDEATSPPPVPADYAQPVKNKNKSSADREEDLYDEAVSANAHDKHSSKVVYTQPFTKTGGVPVPQSDLYTDVKHVRGDAWKQLGRENDEHEENYTSIKRAHEQMDKNAPPLLPAKNYDNDEIDDTYDTVGLKTKTSKIVPKTENLYGVASATEVGELPEIVEPEADYGTDSDEGEEGTYDYPSDDYGGTGGDMYEEAVLPDVPVTKPPPKPRNVRVPDAGLYEDIS